MFDVLQCTLFSVLEMLSDEFEGKAVRPLRRGSRGSWRRTDICDAMFGGERENRFRKGFQSPSSRPLSREQNRIEPVMAVRRREFFEATRNIFDGILSFPFAVRSRFFH